MNNLAQGIAQQLDSDLASVVEEARRSLVQVRNGHRGGGAGTIWHSKGLIVTNAHVVGRGSAASVILPDERELPARVLARDERRDLAALVVDAGDLPTVQLGDSKSLQPGQWVVAVGHPWGIQGAISAGIVIGLGPAWPDGHERGRDYVLVSLHLRPGHSGGPLVDTEGRLVGINTMINGPDVGVAVPVDEVKAFLRESLRA